MSDLKQSTAINLQVWAGDASGVAVTGKVSGDWTKRISKNGGAFGAMTVTVTEMENGWYQVAIDTGHTDTLGPLAITLKASGVLQINERHMVRAYTADDVAARLPASLVSGRIDASVGAMDADVVTATAIQNNAITASKLAASSIGATQIAANAITANKIADGAIDAATFAAGAIDASAIASGALTSAKFASGALASGVFGAGAIDAAAVADDAIDAGAIAATAVAEIVAGVGAVPSAATVAEAVLDAIVDGTATVRGVLARTDAAWRGKWTGLLGSTVTAYLADGVTKAFQFSQSIVAGTRNAATAANGD